MKQYHLIVSRLKKLYPILETVTVDVTDDGYGTSCTYSPLQNSIIIDLAQLKIAQAQNKDRMKLRFENSYKTFTEFFTLCLLHEIRHVYQVAEQGKELVIVEVLNIVDEKTHDSNKLEIDADKWAVTEFRKNF